MRRPTLASLALLVVPTVAFGGAAVTDGTDTLQVKARFKPAKASASKARPRPVELKLDYWARTTDGSRLPDVRSVSVYAGGAVSAFDAFPKCDESKLLERGPSACPKRSKVASGTAIAELRLVDDGNDKSEVPAKVTIFNGKIETNRNGARYARPRDGILFYTDVEGSKIALPFEAGDRNRRVTYRNPKKDPAPPGDNQLYVVKEVHVRFPRQSIRRKGKRIPWMAAPTKCRRRWVVRVTTDRYDGGPLTAKHKVRCRKA